MRIMVTGRAGFIASLVAQAFVEAGQEVQEEIHGPAMPGEQHRSVIENGMAFNELGWYPDISLDEGLALTLAYFRDKVTSSGTR